MVTTSASARHRWLCVLTTCAWAVVSKAQAQPPRRANPEEPARRSPAAPPARPRATGTDQPAVIGSAVPPSTPRSRSILSSQIIPIDLNTALRLAGVQNPEVLVAR